MQKLIDIMKQLRSKDGCPWDKKQSMMSLRRCVLEEAHEVIEAISLKDKDKIEEELGDMLVVVSMLINMGEEKKLLSKKSVLNRAVDKMIYRHPHVFGGKKAKTASEALSHWAEAKDKEKKDKGQKYLLSDIKTYFPSLLLAYKVQKRVARVGFDWDKDSQVIDKIQEELNELKVEIKNKNKKKVKEELGDFLFSAVNLARKLDVDPEIALKESVLKFRKRFNQVEKKVIQSKREWKSFSLEELEEFWQQVKKGR